MIQMDCKQIAKDISKKVKRKHKKDFIKKPITNDNICYNVQIYYMACMDFVNEIVNNCYLYNYEYDIIVKGMMDRY